MLRRYGTKLGPDPASIIAAMIGGIVANNASGMCCGTAQNSYHTLDTMVYVLASGTRIDTADPACDEMLARTEPEIHAAIAAIRDEVRADDDLVALIRRKYSIKNTVGYSLNALIDEDEPARIIARLLVGSEGTLGFIEEVTFDTVPEAQQKWTGFIVYDDVDEACASVPFWREQGAAAIEIMDDASLRSFAHLPTTPDHARVTKPGAAALLVEFHDVEPPESERDVVWETEASAQAVLWRLRKGLMPSVGAMRPPGTTMINEDIAVPPHHLADLVKDVRAAFTTFGYDEGIIFGHAKDGNIHFIVNQSFATEGEKDRYVRFMDHIAMLVVDRYGGSLKAEHGTGRNMAPYVEKEWGAVAYAVMHRVKAALDPLGILNPGVVLNSDPHVHVADIKPVPGIVRDGVATRPPEDLCIECGFCEHVCPSRDLTLTPRQRIVLRRERIINGADPSIVRAIDEAYEHDGIATCATDGLCGTMCPVGIDTGEMIKHARARQTSSASRAVARLLARSMWVVDRVMSVVTRVRPQNGRSHVVRQQTPPAPDVLYVQTCPSRWFGRPEHDMPLGALVTTLASRAGLSLAVLAQGGTCCGQPFASHGHPEASEIALDRLVADAQRAMAGRSIPVLFDTSTCASAASTAFAARGMEVWDQAVFAEHVLSRCEVVNPVDAVVIHPGCGTERFRSAPTFASVAQRCANEVVRPVNAGCCGMGGDRGLIHPELVDAAVRSEVAEIPSHVTLGVSANGLCEQALTARSHVRYTSLLHLVERVTRH
jgi:D-lactate dehydrogenase